MKEDIEYEYNRFDMPDSWTKDAEHIGFILQMIVERLEVQNTLLKKMVDKK